jgi:hypothetical protein
VKVWTEKNTDTEFKDLGDLGFTGALQDRQFAYLRDQGYTNALDDMLAALRGGSLPTVTIVADNLDDDPPSLRLNYSASGTLTWDFHSVATAPAPGEGDIATGTQAVTAGEFDFSIGLSSYLGETGYLYLSLDGGPAARTQEFTVPSPALIVANWNAGTGNAFGTVRTLTAPAGSASGDMVIVIAKGRGTIASPPSPFTLVSRPGSATDPMAIYAAILTGALGDTTWTWSESQHHEIAMFGFPGAAIPDAGDIVSGDGNNSTTDVALSIGPEAANTNWLLVGTCTADIDPFWTPNTRTLYEQSGQHALMSAEYEQATPASATVTFDLNGGNSGFNLHAVAIPIKEA